MHVSPNILAAVRLPFGAAQIVDWQWPSPLDVTVCEVSHMIEMPLVPTVLDGSASLPEISPERFTPIGGVFLRPAGVTVRARSPGGHVRVVRVAVSPEHFATLAGTDLAADEDVLRTALNLTADPPRLLLGQIRDELMRPQFGSDVLVEAYATALVIETVRALRQQLEERRDRGRLAGWQYRRVCERLEAEGAPPSLAELAELCGVSVRHFVRLYRALTGESVTAHIARLQVARAATLLAEEDVPLKEVAVRLGFSHQSSFSSAFRRETGLSPSRYRQQNRRPAHRSIPQEA